MAKKDKKLLLDKVAESLTTTLTSLNGNLSPKQFKRNIKKASKALITGVLTEKPKTTVKKKTALKKTAKATAAPKKAPKKTPKKSSPKKVNAKKIATN